jgi:phage-related minor tail protein
VRNVAVASADAGHVTVGAAKDMAAEYLRFGNIGTTALGDLIKLTRDYAITTGQEVPAATKELGAALSDPLTGLDKLDAKLNFVDAAQRRNILTLAASGKIYQAQQAILDAAPPALAKYGDSVTGIGKAWDFAVNASSKFFEIVGRAGSALAVPPTPTQILERAQSIRAADQGPEHLRT